MIKKDAHNNVNDWINEETDKLSGSWHYGKIELHRDINKIFDGIKTTKCNNCGERLKCNFWELIKDSYLLPLHYGVRCDRWEREENNDTNI